MIQMERWRVTSLVAASLALATLGTFLAQGFTEDAVRSLLRLTARSSVLLFLLAFSASSLRVLFPNRGTAWMARNRRYLGVSFAVSHGIHLLLILALAAWFPHPFVDEQTASALIGGGLAYGFIAAMTLTSFARPRQWIGPRNWQILHTGGSYYLWFIFLQGFSGRAFEDAFYIPFVAALLLAMGLRIARALKQKNGRADMGRVGT